MPDRVVAFRVEEETFSAIDQLRREKGENWKVFTLKAFANRFEGTKMAEAIGTELAATEKPKARIEKPVEPKVEKAKKGKKAKVAEAAVEEPGAAIAETTAE